MSTKKTTPTTADSSGKRELAVITKEILDCKGKIEEKYLQLGKLLIEAKAQVAHGYWFAWLQDNVEISAVTARRYIRLAEEFAKESPVTLFSYSKASVLMVLPEKERDAFIEARHDVNGVLTATLDMSKRELEAAVREHMKRNQPKKNNSATDPHEASETDHDPEKVFADKLATVQDCLAEMLFYLDSLGDYPAKHADLSNDLFVVCENTMQRLALEDNNVA